MKYNYDLVLKINEIYHDVEGQEYEKKHPEIFNDELVRWERAAKLFIANNQQKINLLDIGSGTGFVPLTIGNFLKEGDLFICSDVSSKILNVCRKNIENNKFACSFDYLKLDGRKINLESEKFDYITLNSVLHHIPNLSGFFEEVNRLLKVGGLLIVAHEPNKIFYDNVFLLNNYRMIDFLLNPKKLIVQILKKSGLFNIVRKFFKHFKEESGNSRIINEVNQRLLEDGVIKSNLTGDQIIEIIDIHSPTAGGFHKERGIDIQTILKDYLSNFKLQYLETYNHLCKISSQNKFTRRYNNFLKRKYSENGSLFFAVFCKQK